MHDFLATSNKKYGYYIQARLSPLSDDGFRVILLGLNQTTTTIIRIMVAKTHKTATITNSMVHATIAISSDITFVTVTSRNEMRVLTVTT